MLKRAQANLLVKIEPEGTASAWLEAFCPECGTLILTEFPKARVFHTSGLPETSLAGGQTELASGPVSAECSLETCRCAVRLVFVY